MFEYSGCVMSQSYAILIVLSETEVNKQVTEYLHLYCIFCDHYRMLKRKYKQTQRH